MFFEENQLVKATDFNNQSYTGTIYKMAIQNCTDDNNNPHAIVFISQDKRFLDVEGDFGCVSLWVDKLKSLELLSEF